MKEKKSQSVKCLPILFSGKKTSGFTIIEMIISMAILIIMSTALAGAFSSGFSTYGSSRELQRNLETAQYAMNTLEKYLRTSTVMAETAEGNTSSVVFYDYSSGRCFKYSIVSDQLQVRLFDTTDPFGLLAGPACNTANAINRYPTAAKLVGYVSGNFNVTKSVTTAGSKKMGRVTVSLSVKKDGTATKEARIQATASLRDYKNVGF